MKTYLTFLKLSVGWISVHGSEAPHAAESLALARTTFPEAELKTILWSYT